MRGDRVAVAHVGGQRLDPATGREPASSGDECHLAVEPQRVGCDAELSHT